MLQYIIALIAITAFLILFFRKPNVTTYVLFVLVTLPIMDTKILPLAYGFVRTFDVVTIITFLCLFKEFILFNKYVQHTRVIVLALLFFLFTIIGGFNSEFGYSTYHAYYPVFTIFIFLRFLYIFCSSDRDMNWEIISAFKIGYISILIFMTLQIIIGPEFILYSDIGLNVLNENTGVIRYQGVFGDSQLNGQFMAMGSFTFLMIKSKTSNRIIYFNYLCFSIAVLYIILAGSRSAMGGFIFGMLILFIMSNLRIKLYSVSLGIFSIILLFLIAPNNGVFTRADNLGDDFNFRHSIWKESFEIAKENPLLGIGLGNFQRYTTKYNQDLYLEVSPGEFLYFTQPENGYLKILVEHGGITFIIFILFFLLPFINLLKLIFLNHYRGNCIYLFSSLICWLTAFNTVYSLNDYRLLITVATFLFLLTKMPKRESLTLSMI